MPITALIVLNLALSFYNVWPTPWITSRPEIAIEAVVVVLVMALWVGFIGRPGRRVLGMLAFLVLLLILGRYADVTAPSLYGRPINLYWDSQHLPKVAAMMIRAAPAWQIAIGLTALVLAIAASFLVLQGLLRGLADALMAPAIRRVAYAGTVCLLVLFAGSGLDLGKPLRGWFSHPVSLSYFNQLRLLHEALDSDTALDFAVNPLSSAGLERVAGADVLVFFVESYGATTYDRPEQLGALRATRKLLADTIAHGGGKVVSAFVESPTFGGGSWFAHSSFLSGLEIRDKHRYNLLLASARESLVRRFAGKGYRVLGLMPGVRQAWPEGGYYGFDAIYDAKALDYNGPAFGWWRIPDQFALARVDRRELQVRARAPVFLFFTTISSHAPFSPVPAYQPDWQSLLGPSPYESVTARSLESQKPDWTNLGPSYVKSVDYVLSWVTGYVKERAADDTVMIIIGDHQPAASVTGRDASWDVPVHIITNRAAVIESLRRQGFSFGLNPPRKSIGPMHSLTEMLIRAFSASSPDQAAPLTGVQ